jgi:putative transposase
MKRSRLTEEQIIGVLREQEAGMRVAEVCRKHGISEPTFYTWKAKFGGVSISDAKRLWQLDRAHRITALRVGSICQELIRHPRVFRQSRLLNHQKNTLQISHFRIVHLFTDDAAARR